MFWTVTKYRLCGTLTKTGTPLVWATCSMTQNFLSKTLRYRHRITLDVVNHRFVVECRPWKLLPFIFNNLVCGVFCDGSCFSFEIILILKFLTRCSTLLCFRSVWRHVVLILSTGSHGFFLTVTANFLVVYGHQHLSLAVHMFCPYWCGDIRQSIGLFQLLSSVIIWALSLFTGSGFID